MAIYLGLGSNRGNRRENLRSALTELANESVAVLRVSPVVESPALLPADAPPDWNSPFLNLVAECRSSLSPEELLRRLKLIETRLGRSDARRWAPRPIDIDVLTFDDITLQSDQLVIPHAGLTQRAFVLSPLASLEPGLEIPGTGRTAHELNAGLGRRIPLWMGIVNLAPDSFSDGGENETWSEVESRIEQMADCGVQILDLGAESTRPGATPLTEDEEWERLAPMLARVTEKFADDWLRPRISVDTYHADVAARALDLGVDIINDVGGLSDPRMIELAATNETDFIAMHNLGLPANPNIVLDTAKSAVDQVEAWLDRQLETWRSHGIDVNRVVFDPGIGFGKTPLQSLELLQQIDRFANKGLRILVGHSRKSFMKSFAGNEMKGRDLATIGGSMALCASGVDILRVHNAIDHVAAYRGWAHLQAPS